MKEYIERNAVLRDIIRDKELCGERTVLHPSVSRIIKKIRNAPTADVVERVRGEWIGTQYDGYADGCPVYDEYECSVCGAEYPTDHNFCPNCGADMRKEEA